MAIATSNTRNLTKDPKTGRILLIDFGLSAKHEYCRGATITHQPPELKFKHAYINAIRDIRDPKNFGKSDVYALGLMICSIYKGCNNLIFIKNQLMGDQYSSIATSECEKPFAMVGIEEDINLPQNKHISRFYEFVDTTLLEMSRKMVSRIVGQRPKSRSVLFAIEWMFQVIRMLKHIDDNNFEEFLSLSMNCIDKYSKNNEDRSCEENLEMLKSVVDKNEQESSVTEIKPDSKEYHIEEVKAQYDII